MPLSRDTKVKRLDSLDAQIRAARAAYERHTERAEAAEKRERDLRVEREWIAQAPVADPAEDEAGGGQG